MSDDQAGRINRTQDRGWAGAVGLVLDSATRDAVSAHVVVDAHHRQPHGIVHGGVYASIIESMASIGAALDARERGKDVVGLENHTSFVRAVREGTLRARATPVTRGRRTQLWDVVIENEEQAVVATGRVRLLVLEPDAEVGGKQLRGGSKA